MTEVSPSNSSDKTGNDAVIAECSEAGEELSAISGGATLSGSTRGVAIVETRPTGLEGEVPAGWTASAVEINSNSGFWTLTVYVVCAKVN